MAAKRSTDPATWHETVQQGVHSLVWYATHWLVAEGEGEGKNVDRVDADDDDDDLLHKPHAAIETV